MKNSFGYIVSFIIPMYNVEKYIATCLDSILQQTGIHKEIIVIDDGSSDNSLKILKEYQKRNENIILYEQNHQGASVARNAGIDVAKGDWICFVDSDDYLEKNCMEEIYKQISDDLDVIFTDYAKTGRNRETKFTYHNTSLDMTLTDFELFQKAMLNKNHNPENLQIVTPWAKLYRTDFLRENHLKFTPGVRKSQDLLFNFEVYQFAKKGKYIPVLMYYYRFNAESLCNKHLPGVLTDYLKQSGKLKDLLKKYDKFGQMEQDYYFRCAVNFMFSLRLDYVHPDNKKKYRERKKGFENALEIEDVKEAINNVDEKEFSYTERVLFKAVRNKHFGIIQLLNLGYRMIEKLK